MKHLHKHTFIFLIFIVGSFGIVLAISGFSYNINSDLPLSGNENTAENSIFLPILMTPSIRNENVFKINIPYFNGDIKTIETAISWFGRVTPTENYADVRLGYNDIELYVDVIIFDRRLWYDDQTPSTETLSDWDAVSLYLDLDGNTGGVPDTSSYKFIGQLYRNTDATPEDSRASYRGNGSEWVIETIQFSTGTNWRGNFPNDDVSDKGWRIKFHIPFTSLGFSNPPPKGLLWGIAIALHDRDDFAGTPIIDQDWPHTMDPDSPDTWGQIAFGLPDEYIPPVAVPSGETLIRQGLNSAEVVDAHVGGHTTCGTGLTPYFTYWGEANYAGYKQINIQNQTDVSDWPCFSKYYVTFPLDALPPGKVILSATLQMYQFSNAGRDPDRGPQPSLIQVLLVQDDWEESSMTWNNAPLPIRFISRTWVDPIPEEPPDWPGIRRDWDVSQAVSNAYVAKEPLRLALYSADYAQHSGKYFYSSDAGEEARPRLRIIWGNP